MVKTRYQIGLATVVALVALRLGVGYHFFTEGAKKFHDDNFTAVAFLQQATGPLAEFYHRMIPDRYGRQRLNLKRTKNAWASYRDRVAQHFRFHDSQRDKAAQVYKQWERRLNRFFADNREELQEYFRELDKLHEAKSDPNRRDVAFGRRRIAAKEGELRRKLNGWVAQLKSMGQQYEYDLHTLALDTQIVQGRLAMPDRSRSWVDAAVKYLIISVGVCLVVGLLTRTAATAGACFLGSVILSQPPWVADVQATYFYYQMVELLAMLLLAATGAGRFAGLDFFIHAIRMRCCPPAKGDE